jgi:hypothetical protein
MIGSEKSHGSFHHIQLPFHLHGVASEALQVDIVEPGSMRLLDRARRATPSELKLQDDQTNVENIKNQSHKTCLILMLEKNRLKSAQPKNRKSLCFSV